MYNSLLQVICSKPQTMLSEESDDEVSNAADAAASRQRQDT